MMDSGTRITGTLYLRLTLSTVNRRPSPRSATTSRPLSIPQRVQLKLCLLTYKALHGLAASYITDLCRPLTSHSHPSAADRDRLRSSATRGDLVVSSSVMHFGARAFAVAGPKAWNQLTTDARESVGSFKTALKTHFHFVD